MVFDKNRKKAVLFDPTRHSDVFLEYLHKKKLKLVAVVDTHIHADHVSGGLLLSKKLHIPYLLPRLSNVAFQFTELEKKLSHYIDSVLILKTPGHTDESVCIVLDNTYLLTGDTLFFESVGRSDLRGDIEKNIRLLYQSIKQKLMPLDGDLTVLPAHNQKSMMPNERAFTMSLSEVKKRNPVFNLSFPQKQVKKIVSAKIETPANFHEIKKINSSSKYPNLDYDELEFGANKCSING